MRSVTAFENATKQIAGEVFEIAEQIQHGCSKKLKS